MSKPSLNRKSASVYGFGQIAYFPSTFFSRMLSSALGRNVLSLYILQFANYMLPFIIVPYLVRVLGPEKFGMIAFGQSLVTYCVLLVNYGFDLSATRSIARQRNNLQQIGKIAWAVWGAKILLCVLSLILLTGVIAFVPRFRAMSCLLYILFGIVIGNVLFPQWLFQGLEQMVIISVINLGVRLLITAGIFIVIRQPEDFLKYAALLSGQWIGAGIIGFIWSITRLRIPVKLPALDDLICVLREGWTVFLSTAAISLYTTSNTFILGLLANNTIVGYYAAAEKVVKALHGLVSPLSQGFYPRVSNRASFSREEGLRWASRALVYMGGLGLIISLVLVTLAPLIVNILLGPKYSPAISVMRVLATLPFLIALSNVFGIQVMLPFHLDRAFFTILVVAGLINILTALLLVPIWGAMGTAISVAFTEFYVTATMFFYLKSKNLLPIRPKGVA